MEEKDKKTNLIDNKSVGGQIAQKGFNFQQEYIVAKIPYWLSHHGFESFIHEATGDVESKFFLPGYGNVIELSEIKDHNVSPKEFWEEINYFHKLNIENPGQFVQFILVAPSYSKGISPVINSLARFQKPQGFYSENSSIFRESKRELIRIIKKKNHSEEKAIFLFEKVKILTWPKDINSFAKNMTTSFPSYSNIPISNFYSLENEIFEIVSSNLNTLITRKKLERIFNRHIPIENPQIKSIHLLTGIDQGDFSFSKSLTLDLSKYWGGKNRQYPEKSEWDKLIAKLEEIKKWVLDNRTSRQLYLMGNRRLSTALAIGSVFSAVSGFSIDLEYRQGEIYSTADHTLNESAEFEMGYSKENTDELAVIIGINKDINTNVKNYLNNQFSITPSILNILVKKPIQSIDTNNSLVRNTKEAINKSIPKTGKGKIHLFINGPSFFALFLGHRLNALPPIQCYEWIEGSTYIPTCLLS